VMSQDIEDALSLQLAQGVFRCGPGGRPVGW